MLGVLLALAFAGRLADTAAGASSGRWRVLPSIETTGDGRRIVWKLPVYNTVRSLLTNPVYYGGAYAFGRTASRITVENGGEAA